jgi:hypothetical protein
MLLSDCRPRLRLDCPQSERTTVDWTYVPASRYFDLHTSYVALSRDRDGAMLFWGRAEFAGRGGQGGQNDSARADPRM